MLLDATQDNDADLWGLQLRGQTSLGDEEFAERMRARATPAARLSREVPARQPMATVHGPARVAWLQANNGQRAQALHAAYPAYRVGWKSMPGLAAECGLSVAHVSRLIRAMGAAEEP